MTYTPPRKRSLMTKIRLTALGIFCMFMIATGIVHMTSEPRRPAETAIASGHASAAPIIPSTESREK